MEELKMLIINNWSTILEYALMFVAYFLVFLYKGKVGNTETTLRTLFTENRTAMKAEFDEARVAYTEARKKIVTLEIQLHQTKRALAALIADTEVEDGNLSNDETN